MRKIKIGRSFVVALLLLSVIIGAGYRAIVLKQEFQKWNGFESFMSLASHFQKTLGRFSFDETMAIQKDPDSYVYTNGKSKFVPESIIDNELGWTFILSLILKEGTKGINNLALTLIRYQMMIELLVIVLLFIIGKRIFGMLGAFLAAYLYAVFKLPMTLASWAVYYYWTIPFVALSVFFWLVIYKGEEPDIKLKYFYCFLYGILIGFATFVRLYFIYLPLCMSPLLLIKERSFKKWITILLIIFIGQSVFMVPQILITKKHHGVYALSTRGTWHTIIQGVGAYKNPWGIVNTGDITVADWIAARGGPVLNKDGIMAYDKFCRQEAFKMLKEHPEVFISNAISNIKAGITISPHWFEFLGLPKKFFSYAELNKTFPWLVLSSLLILLVVSRQRLWMMAVICFHAIYLLCVVLLYFPNYIPFIASYIPVFVLLLAMALTVYAKLIVATITGIWSCLAGRKGIGSMAEAVTGYFQESCESCYSRQLETNTYVKMNEEELVKRIKLDKMKE